MDKLFERFIEIISILHIDVLEKLIIYKSDPKRDISHKKKLNGFRRWHMFHLSNSSIQEQCCEYLNSIITS